MRKNLKAKYWKRTLAFLLALSMILTGNAFSVGAVSVYAAEKEEEVSGEVISPEEGAAKAEDSTETPDAGDALAAGEAGDSTGAPDAGDAPAAGEAEESTGTPDAGDVSAVGEEGDSTDMPDAGEAGDSTDTPDEEDVPDAVEVEESAEVLESTDTIKDGNPEEENQDVESYGVIGLTGNEFEEVKQDVEILWSKSDDEELSSYEKRWEFGADTETILSTIYNDEDTEYEYAYIQPFKPDIEDRTITIPSTIKGVIIGNGWVDEDTGEEGGEGNGYPIDIPVDTLNVKGTATCVYFGKGSNIDAGDSNILNINFPEDNKNKVVFDDNSVNAVINCDSESGTIAFGHCNKINGYTTKSATEFYAAKDYEDTEPLDYSDLVIKEAGGLSFEEITGEVDVSIIFNGYPEDIENLPHFNKEIRLKEVSVEEGSEPVYDGSVTIKFKTHKENLFEGDEDSDSEWWDSGAPENVGKGTQVAYFAGETKNEIESISCRVGYWDDSKSEAENNLHISYTGCLAEDGEDESCAYRVLKLDNGETFNEVKEDIGKIWDNFYDELWNETDKLAAYLEREDLEYVVIQARVNSHELEDKVLNLPSNLKGVMLVPDYIPVPGGEEGADDKRVEWQLDTLKVKAGTEVYMNGININTNGNNLNIDLAAATSKVVFADCIVNALINCESEAGTIEFVNDNILNGYKTKTVTNFSAFQSDNTDNADDENNKPRTDAKLLINEAAGLSFESITGNVDVLLIFNGYPENAELENKLPHFYKKIELGKGTDDNGNPYDRDVSIRFWEHQDKPFELDKDWWEKVDAVDLKEGARVAYFEGKTQAENEEIQCNVNYYDHTHDDNGLYLSYTGLLEKEGEEESGAYRVLKLDNADAYNEVKADTGLLWDEKGPYYDRPWDETSALEDFLKGDLEYVVIQAKKESHELEDKTLKLPGNIKGALLLSDYAPVLDDENDQRVEWYLNTIKAEGSKEIYIDDVAINPIGQAAGAADADPADQGFKIETTSADVNVVMVNSEIMGDLSVSGIAGIKFKESKIYGALYLPEDKSTKVGLEGLIVADNLSGYSALDITGDTTFIVRYHGAVVIENCKFTRTNQGDEGQGLTLVYNGYPAEADLLPEFGDNIDFPDKCGITLRFVQQSDDLFWEGDWWEKTPDELLLLGSQIATVKVDGDKFENLMEHLGYWSSNDEFVKNIELVKDEAGGALRIQKTNPETGKRVVDFVWSADKTKVYDSTAFTVNKNDVTNNCGYTGETEFAWLAKDGTALTQVPKDAGEYKLKMSVPADDQKFEGETTADVTITPKTVTVSIKPDESKTDGYEIIWTGFVEGETYITQAEIVKGEEITEDNKKYCMVSTKGGDAGGNYTIVHADPVKIAVKEKPLVNEKRPIINSVKFPKNQESYSAVYTGEQIRPAMAVAYTYTDGSKTKTQKLKLNVDYTLTYQNNVNAGNNTAKVTVRGIGEFSGVITKEFSITPKSIKKVTLSAVGDILYGDAPVVTVMDGTYELVEGEDYKIKLTTKGSADADTPSELTVEGIGNYNETSGKKVKFNILKSSTATSTEIKSIAADSVTVEFKNASKVYTYNGKAQKAAVVVKDGGVKVPASQYKVIYSNNVNAGTKTATVKVVGVTKKGKGYYGVSKELKFDIQQKNFAKVSVSSIAPVPKTSSFEGVTMTVKDGKRILTENVDYTVDYSSILNNDGTFKETIVTGQKYPLTLKPVGGKNYIDTSTKTVYVKFGQLNLASKTANISVTIKDVSNSKVEVMYNGVLLKEGTDYTVKLKQDKGKSTYTATITAVKKSAYKGKKVAKNLVAPTTSTDPGQQ